MFIITVNQLSVFHLAISQFLKESINIIMRLQDSVGVGVMIWTDVEMYFDRPIQARVN